MTQSGPGEGPRVSAGEIDGRGQRLIDPLTVIYATGAADTVAILVQ